ASDGPALGSAVCSLRASSGSRGRGIPPRAHGILPPSGPRAHAPSHCGMRGNLLSWGPPPLSILEWRLSRSFRSRCDCDHKKAFFHLGPAVRGAREKITFLKWVRGVFPGKNRSRKRGLIGANYGGDCSGALAAMPGLVALAMCRQGPLASPAVQAAGACAALSREGGSPLGFAVEDRLVLHAIVAREPAHQRTVHPIVEHP